MKIKLFISHPEFKASQGHIGRLCQNNSTKLLSLQRSFMYNNVLLEYIRQDYIVHSSPPSHSTEAPAMLGIQTT